MSNPFRDNIVGMNEDRMETCKGCGAKWYAKWYKDGFCHDCQHDGTHEDYLSQLALSKALDYGKLIVLGILILIIIAFVFI